MEQPSTAQKHSPDVEKEPDQDPLFLPIEETNPAGPYKRYDSLYDAIKKARQTDDPSLPQGIWAHKLKTADFRAVEKLCYEALCKETKDIQLAVWLVEAWVSLYGAEGLVQGCTMLKKMLETFWSVLHPKLDDPLDPSLRLSPLIWMSDKLPQSILLSVPLVHPKYTKDVPITFSVIKQAQELEKRINKSGDPKSIENDASQKGENSLGYYTSLLEKVSPEVLADFKKSLNKSHHLLEEVEIYINTQLPNVGFAFSRLKKLFRDFEIFLQPYFFDLEEADKNEKHDNNVIAAEENDDTINTTTESFFKNSKESPLDEDAMNKPPKALATRPSKQRTSSPLTDALHSRQEAYRQLKAISTYLMKLEPHSPSPYLIRKAIAWGDMSLEQLFTEIMEGGGDLSQFMAWLGMKKGSSSTPHDEAFTDEE